MRRPVPSQGAGLSVILLLSLLPLACGGPGPEPSEPETERARALGLEEGARVHQVILGGRGSEEHVLPFHVEAAPGDAVEFVTVDNRIHTVLFPPDSLTPGVRAFLLGSSQDRSPPLLSRGSRFVLLLEGAPPGDYPFMSQGHGGLAYGLIRVGPPAAAGDSG